MLMSDIIANMIEEMLREGNGELELKRNDLAGRIGCVPSQINYVLSTRFTLDKGFAIESRRGGGGYVTLVRLNDEDSYIAELVRNSIGDRISFQRVCQILDRLEGDGIISQREKEIAKSMTSDKAILSYDKLSKEVVRAGIFKSFLTLLMKSDFGGDD